MRFERDDDFLESLGSSAKPLYLVERSPEEKAANAAAIRERTLGMRIRRYSGGCVFGFVLATIIL